MIGFLEEFWLLDSLAILSIFEGYLEIFENYIPPTPFWLVLTNRVIYSFSIVTPYEEIIMRGFLWGYLRQAGLSENKACWIQGSLFLVSPFKPTDFPPDLLYSFTISYCCGKFSCPKIQTGFSLYHRAYDYQCVVR